MSGIITGATVILGGDADTPQPSQVIPHPLITVGSNGEGFAVEQGYRGWTLRYSELDQDEYSLLLALYATQQATATATAISIYDPDTGATETGTCLMGRPQIGNVYLLLNGVTVELTRYIPA